MNANTNEPSFVVCIANNDCDDLEIRKLYQVLPDAEAVEDGLLRIVDESGEDYLYPANLFLKIELPQDIQKVLLHAA